MTHDAKPRKPAEKRLANAIPIRFTDAELEALRIAADADGRTISGFIRHSLRQNVIGMAAAS